MPSTSCQPNPPKCYVTLYRFTCIHRHTHKHTHTNTCVLNMGLLLEVYFHAHFHDNWDNNSDDVNISLQQVGAQIRFGHLDAMVWQKCKHQRLLV